jgi:outer membrane protein W
MKARWIAAATLLLATAVYADDGLTVFVNEIERDRATSSTFSVAGEPATTRTVSEWTGGFGVAFSHSWNARWSAEGSIGLDQHYMDGLRFIASTPVTTHEKVRTIPVDLMMRFQFPNDSRWKPYVGGGARYVGAPDITVADISTTPNPAGLFPVAVRRLDSRLSAQVGIGTTFMITPRVGLQFDVKRLLRNDSIAFDPLTRGSFGVHWKV